MVKINHLSIWVCEAAADTPRVANEQRSRSDPGRTDGGTTHTETDTNTDNSDNLAGLHGRLVNDSDVNQIRIKLLLLECESNEITFFITA